MLLFLLQTIIDGLAGILSLILFVLPDSPFQSLQSVAIDNKYLQWLAWIVPFPQIIVMLEAWLTAIVLYYVYIVILRWVKAIE